MLKLDQLKRHTGIGRSFAAKVSMSPRGMISISDGAVRRYGLDKFGYAALYYDDDDKIVAIEPLTEKGDDVLTLRGRSTGAYLAAASFLGNFQIKLTGTIIYDLKKDEESGLLYFELKSGKARKAGKEDLD